MDGNAAERRGDGGGKRQKLRKLEKSDEPESFARCYQLEALETAKKRNTIVFLDTGAGKTLIAVMLLRFYAHFIRKPSDHIAVFLVPTVVLVKQQADVLELHTDLKVGKFWGEMGVDFWDLETWNEKLKQFEVFIMTPQILLNNLRHTFFALERIKLLVFDECHHARGKDPYACIMLEFYHARINSNNLPRIFGMTASLTNSKGSISPAVYGKQIRDLENLMHSKVYTVSHESVLAEYISFPNPRIKLYSQLDMPSKLNQLVAHLETLEAKHVKALKDLMLEALTFDNSKRKISKLCATIFFCLKELGLWLAIKASETLSKEDNDIFFWGESTDRIGEQVMQKFSQDIFNFLSAKIPSGWNIGNDLKEDVDAGFLTSKVSCLIQSLLEYRMVKNLKCIVFVQRIVTAIVLQSLLCQIKELSGWGIRYMAGNRSGLHSQTRNQQISIVDEFRDGKVNIIVATQILEEGLDVQSCNLVVRFDPAANVCSFIQSRGRARMQGSDYLLIVKKDDSPAISQLQTFLKSGEIMRGESLRIASLPCIPMKEVTLGDSYHVESTGATVNLNSSIALIYFYCSRLPSDGYFKPHPRFEIDMDSKTCTLHLPKSCPLQVVRVNGTCSMIRQVACLEACKRLHEIGALSDHLIPVMDDTTEVAVEKVEDVSCKFEEENYFPAELVDSWSAFCSIGQYHCYKISMNSIICKASYGDIFLVLKSDLGSDFVSNSFNLQTSKDSVSVHVDYFGIIHLNRKKVLIARRFQVSVLSLLIYQDYEIYMNALHSCLADASSAAVYLLLPSVSGKVNWDCVDSSNFSLDNRKHDRKHCCASNAVAQLIKINNGFICRCMLHHSIVYTPHNGHIYCIAGILDVMDINSCLKLRSGKITTYSKYFHSRHGLKLEEEKAPLLAARRLPVVHNFLLRRPLWKERVSCDGIVELPAELCIVLMSPISPNTFHTFSLIPSVMHRFQCMILAARLKASQLDQCRENAVHSMKVLEAITTKRCREEFSLESLETLGDSFLKYAASEYLFKNYPHYHQGLLSSRRIKMIANYVLCRLGRNRNISGFIRTEEHDPKQWIIPGEQSDYRGVTKICIAALPDTYSSGRRCIRIKVVADSVEALIGAYLVTGGEVSALLFLKWLGMEIDHCKNIFIERPVLQRPELYVNLKDLQLLLNYTFHDSSLLVEALTHGSYQVSDIPRCYQRLEFLGDAVLDYLITMHLHSTYPGASPGLLTDLRSASVNNDCYAHAAARVGLNKHILHASSELHRQMSFYLKNVTSSFSGSSHGWDAGIALPKVLADVIESLAGAIYLDSGSDMNLVWISIRPLLEPLVTPDTMELNPMRELVELCSRNSYTKTFAKSFNGGLAYMSVEVNANGCLHKSESTGPNKKVAKKIASKQVLHSLKACNHA